ncbi:acetyl/propionyl/methylcrotonyl-CoA carboxylase subunit alpha [Aureimonas flava]|uniref:propionyl-CoA carboxylase n=1 Tax=Aureimonas flava TaxID=2320271 RepID=A0A3A1WKF6_9HYPH|nr:acetyl/propionyl/methylcrotonyl-CoA carboxylase subunit alpha [Aureimonas flava]RIY01630.1 acetyl/propionyl/methylcrotonyl-CoA carboxylase subunit alpha [Aureimonas flava]
MFRKILVANRGEIACRVMRTAQRMGIATVAVYSDADARAPHVLMADEAVRLGPAPAAESYLRPDLILEAARATGADCIHPGYGFLSERESFARACEEAGIAFVGPPPGAIAAMGDKIQSKKLAKTAGVNVVPGFLGEIADTAEAVRIAAEIGFPVMMKASAGGGGKGMRLAWSEADVREGFDAVKREGLASFGDDRVFIEKFVESPRHIEIQVLGDRHGTVLYLGERECSIQRRHQKVVEEAPSPFVTPEMRRAMGEQAVALAKAVGYHSAGTVELIVSGADPTGKSFYFLEMNTRLQVEHPVTEMVTGLDLVEEMIRVAAGERLRFAQDEVRLDGWSVETRIYAEDPYRGFLPSTGRLTRYGPPPVGDGVRVDDGVAEGSEVSMFYDPMIAKLVTHGPTREAAIDRQVRALDRFELRGLGHNVDFLSAIMQHDRFRAGALTTGFIAEEYPEGFAGVSPDERLAGHLAVAAVLVATMRAERDAAIDGQLGAPIRPAPRRVAELGDRRFVVAVSGGSGARTVSVDGAAPVAAALDWPFGDAMARSVVGEEELWLRVAPTLTGARLTARGATHDVRVSLPRVDELQRHMLRKEPPDLSRFLICPMPGLLTQLHVAAGDRVEAGQVVGTIEAMKMENNLRAAKAATVAAVHASVGESLPADFVILEFA